MHKKIIITCAVTGSGDTVGKHPAIPVTPEQIANSALEAASAGAAVVHLHVRDPVTGKGCRGTHLYREVMERIRARNREVIINLTAGMGGDVWVGDGENPRDYIEVSLRVSERKYTSWPPYIRKAFEPARTVKAGRETFGLIAGDA